ncbi:hypothetical protein Q8G41_28735, partial [Klebsiella pneumoniae]|uniref:hypothetical protein n=1 Tax=Klebsiella pneumoniae TaxID=573 RepID=UPI00301401A3
LAKFSGILALNQGMASPGLFMNLDRERKGTVSTVPPKGIFEISAGSLGHSVSKHSVAERT